ncbi:MAG TPA: Ig-like domain-containing protein [Solirubrobacteraceae bacterium]|nr:Ig-like domain-containing protein [Solirubrobacteraceae bacterium]
MTQLLVALAGVAAFTVGGFGMSGATFVAHTSSPANSFSTYPDWVAPVVSITAPADGTRTPSSTPAISGSAGTLPGDLATVTVDIHAGAGTGGPVVQTRTASRNPSTGAWSITPTALADGTYTARAHQDDSFLNTGYSAPVSFTVDTVAPAPTITVPAAGATVGPTATISGAAGNAVGDAATLTVNVYAGATPTGTPVRTLIAARTGATWSVAVSPALGSGTFTARASQVDDVGHTGLSNARTFIVDATAPAPTITQPTAGQWLTTATPLIKGTAGNASGDSTTVTVKLYAGASATGTPVQTLTTTRSGTAWSITPAALTDGQYTAQATQSDAVGNVGTSAARSFYVDTSTPVVSIASPMAGQRVGARPPISGTAGILLGDSATVTVRIYSGTTTGGALVQTLTATRNATTGAFSVTPATLADGTYTAQASQSDSAGHTGTSAPVTFIADGTPPAGVAITAPTTNQRLATQTPTIAGTAGNATGDDTTLTVNLYAGAAASGTPIAVLSAPRSGTSWSIAVASALADGQYTAQAKQGDASGNVTTTAARTFFVDTTAPVVAISAPAPGQLVTGQPPISGTGGILTGDNAQITVRIYAGSTPTGPVLQTLTTNRNGATGAWTVTPATLISGTYTATATQTDTAGNTGVSAPVTFTTDSVKPTALPITTANGTGGGQVAGRLDSGDSISFPYSEAMNPATILAGWDGSATAINARFINAGTNDGLTLLNAAATATLGIAGGTTTTSGVRFAADFVSGNVTFSATMTMSADRKTVTVVLGTPDLPANIKPGPAGPANSTWTVNTAAHDLAGNAVTAGNVAETDNDRDF